MYDASIYKHRCFPVGNRTVVRFFDDEERNASIQRRRRKFKPLLRNLHTLYVRYCESLDNATSTQTEGSL